MDDLKHGPLIQLTKPHKIFLGLVLLLVVLTTSFKIHGFSLPEWRPYIDNSAMTDTILNRSRGIRSDDWLVNLPMIYAQVFHNPPYPEINENIGLGQNMFGLTEVPIAHPIAIFRPWSWGYFFGEGVGMAWHWNVKEYGLIYTTFLLIMLLSRSNFALSLGGSLLVAYSSFAQYWALNNAPVLMTAMLCVIFAAYTFFAEKKWVRVSSAVLLGWAGGCFLNTLYPPYQIPLAYVFLALCGVIAYQKRDHLKEALRKNAMLLGISLAIFAFASIIFYLGLRPVLPEITGTVYPGKRFITGGGLTLEYMFANMLLNARLISAWGPLGNICEASNFIFLFSFTIPAMIVRSLLAKKLPKVDELIILAVLFVFLGFVFVGYPAWFVSATLLSQVPEARMVIGVGILDMLLLVLFIVNTKYFDLTKQQKNITALVGILFMLTFLSYIWSQAELSIPDFRANVAGLWVAGLAIAALLIIHAPRSAMILLGIASVVNTAWFNPRVVSGAQFITGNPLSQKILEIKETTHNKATWVTYGNIVNGNLLRMLGVKNFTGVYFHPQLNLWHQFDPNGKYENAYNRYAHVQFQISNEPSAAFVSPGPDVVTVVADPDDINLKNNGIDYILFTGDPQAFASVTSAFDIIFSYGPHHIYKRKDEVPAESLVDKAS